MTTADMVQRVKATCATSSAPVVSGEAERNFAVRWHTLKTESWLVKDQDACGNPNAVIVGADIAAERHDMQSMKTDKH